jgi:hypothetical protein
VAALVVLAAVAVAFWQVMAERGASAAAVMAELGVVPLVLELVEDHHQTSTPEAQVALVRALRTTKAAPPEPVWAERFLYATAR